MIPQLFLDIFGNYDQILLNLVLLIGLSLFLQRTLVVIGQKWVETFAHTATLLLLPVITYILTTLISGDIALSLGMVGALSIVRFRNPVRSPFELTIYFTSITAGVAASVNWKWLVLLMACVVAVCLFLNTLEFGSKLLRNKSYFSVSFTEGNHLSTIEVYFSDGGTTLGHDDSLVSIDCQDGSSTYVFASANKARIREIYNTFEKHPSLVRLQMHL